MHALDMAIHLSLMTKRGSRVGSLDLPSSPQALKAIHLPLMEAHLQTKSNQYQEASPQPCLHLDSHSQTPRPNNAASMSKLVIVEGHTVSDELHATSCTNATKLANGISLRLLRLGSLTAKQTEPSLQADLGL